MPEPPAGRNAVRRAPYALRITLRKDGRAAVVYRRQADAQGRDRLRRLAALSPLATQAATALLRDAVREGQGAAAPGGAGAEQVLTPGAFHPLDAGWGARVACYALVAAGLRNGERLIRAADNLRHADPDQATWWMGLLTQHDNLRALRALRILMEAVE